MSGKNPKNCIERENLVVSLEYEHAPDAEERLLKIFEFLLQEQPEEITLSAAAK